MKQKIYRFLGRCSGTIAKLLRNSAIYFERKHVDYSTVVRPGYESPILGEALAAFDLFDKRKQMAIDPHIQEKVDQMKILSFNENLDHHDADEFPDFPVNYGNAPLPSGVPTIKIGRGSADSNPLPCKNMMPNT